MSGKTVQEVIDNLALTPEEKAQFADLITECKKREIALKDIAERNETHLRALDVASADFAEAMDHFGVLMYYLKTIIRSHRALVSPPDKRILH